MINALMVLYLTKHLHVAEHAAYSIFAAFMALIFALQLPGGYTASRLGYKQSVCVGVVFCAVGMVIVSTLGLEYFYMGFGLYIAGYSLALPALFSLPTLAYAQDDPHRASGMTLFYILMNLGFLFSAFSSGYISEWLSYEAAFLIATGSLVIGFIMMLLFYNKITAYKASALQPILQISKTKTIIFLLLFILVVAPIACYLIQYNHYTDLIMWGAIAASIFVILMLARQQKDRQVKLRLYALLLLNIIGLFFWVIYMLEPSVVTLFIAHNVDRNVFGHLVPTATFYSLDPIFVIAIGFLLSYLWRFLAKQGKLPSIPTKFSLAIIVMGLGSIVFYAGITSAGPLNLTHYTWVVLGYLFFSVAELLIAPIAIAMIGKLSPHNHVGTMMGIFNLFVGFAAILAGYVGGLTSLPKHASIATGNAIYSHTFLVLGCITIVLGLLSACMIPVIKRLIVHR